MRICYITAPQLQDFILKNITELGKTDVLLICYSVLKNVNFEDELTYKTDYMNNIAAISKDFRCVVFAGADTDNFGDSRHSVIVADGGRLLGISDAVYSDDIYQAGSGIIVYNTSKGRFGVIVNHDLYFGKASEILAQSGSDLNINIIKDANLQLAQLMGRSHSFITGVPHAVCSDNFCFLGNIKGEAEFISSKSIQFIDIEIDKKYHKITFLSRGGK